MAQLKSSFIPSLKAEDLPGGVLTRLWERTAAAHEHLFHLWHAAASGRFGEEVADQLLGEASATAVTEEDLVTRRKRPGTCSLLNRVSGGAHTDSPGLEAAGGRYR